MSKADGREISLLISLEYHLASVQPSELAHTIGVHSGATFLCLSIILQCFFSNWIRTVSIVYCQSFSVNLIFTPNLLLDFEHRPYYNVLELSYFEPIYMISIIFCYILSIFIPDHFLPNLIFTLAHKIIDLFLIKYNNLRLRRWQVCFVRHTMHHHLVSPLVVSPRKLFGTEPAVVVLLFGVG